MNAFDLISEPVLFTEEPRGYSDRVRQSVELIQVTTRLPAGSIEVKQAYV